MSTVTITHPLALEDTPEKDSPRYVTVAEDESYHKVRVRPDGTFEGNASVLYELAEAWGVEPERLTDDGRIVG